jgi:Copper type II ascorbate-dependent monooxygenase, N-terminal domain/Copper type II ascorbate-dependent monooxygenase, C-terminal domain
MLSDNTQQFIHHAVVSVSTKTLDYSKSCLANAVDHTIFPWASGVSPFILPDVVGIKLGPSSDDSGFQTFRFQIHYDNPSLIPNMIDTTTARIYYTMTPRPHELGFMGLGDAIPALRGVEIPAGLSQYDFYCSPDCTEFVLDEPVTVFQDSFHMHTTGLSAVTYHIRNDEIIRQANVDFFDFEQSGALTSMKKSSDAYKCLLYTHSRLYINYRCGA